MPTALDQFRFRIAGFGSAVPSQRLDNQHLACELNLDREWIEKRCGIQSRWVAGDAETTTSLAITASQRALAVAPERKVDLVICCTFTPDHLLCPSAPAIAAGLQLESGAFDLNAACSAGVVGLLTALQFLASGAASRVLLVCSDTTTKFLDSGDVDTRIIFGDAASALVLDTCESNDIRVRSFAVGSDGSAAGLFRVPNGGSANRGQTNGRDRSVIMNGSAVFRSAVRVGSRLVQDLCDKAGLKPNEINWVIPHQANARIIQSLQETSSICPSRWVTNLREYDNTASASVTLALVDSLTAGLIKTGQRVLLAGFGAGLTWGGLLLEW
jgi:3-oxoacyl-[acyl-carrier-protein] synthase III